MKAIGLLKYFKTKKGTTYKMMCKVSEAIAELQALENRSCNNCKNASFEVKFGELEFNACFLVSNGNICKWESK